MITWVEPEQRHQILLFHAQGNLEEHLLCCPCASFSFHPDA
jgi:hypothetical protein